MMECTSSQQKSEFEVQHVSEIALNELLHGPVVGSPAYCQPRTAQQQTLAQSLVLAFVPAAAPQRRALKCAAWLRVGATTSTCVSLPSM